MPRHNYSPQSTKKNCLTVYCWPFLRGKMKHNLERIWGYTEILLRRVCNLTCPMSCTGNSCCVSATRGMGPPEIVQRLQQLCKALVAVFPGVTELSLLPFSSLSQLPALPSAVLWGVGMGEALWLSSSHRQTWELLLI